MLVRELAACGPAVAGDILTRMSCCITCADDEAGSEEADEQAAVAGVRALSRLRALATEAGRPLLDAAAAAVRAPPSIASRAASARIRTSSGLARGDVLVAGVPLPLLSCDAPSPLPAATALAARPVQSVASTPVPDLSRYPPLEVCGWASDVDALARQDARAAEARRSTLLSLLLGCLQQAEEEAPRAGGGSEGGLLTPDGLRGGGAAADGSLLTATGSIGHWLLGLQRSVAPSLQQQAQLLVRGGGGAPYTIPRPGEMSCLHAVVSLLGIDGFAERRPAVAQRAAAVVHALLSGLPTRRCTLAFLQVRSHDQRREGGPRATPTPVRPRRRAAALAAQRPQRR